MNQRQSQQPSNGRRQNHGQGKAARPGLHRRVHSYHNAHSQTHCGSKPQAAPAKKAAREEVKQPEEDEDMAGLPQFCMSCERQIVNPSSKTLYCSRSCQRRDSAKPAPIEPVVSPACITAPSYFDVPQPDILPQRSPTVLRPVSLTFSDLHLSDSGSPSESNDDASDERNNRYSNATRYYGHCDNSDSTLSSSLSGRRPHITRSSTSTLPSLSHTPSSSVGTAASFTSTRPLPSRYDPLGGHRSMKSADLVIPTFAGPSSADASVKSGASTLTSFHAAEAGDVTYAKQDTRRQSPATGSLRQLFMHDAVASTPKGSQSGLK